MSASPRRWPREYGPAVCKVRHRPLCARAFVLCVETEASVRKICTTYLTVSAARRWVGLQWPLCAFGGALFVQLSGASYGSVVRVKIVSVCLTSAFCCDVWYTRWPKEQRLPAWVPSVPFHGDYYRVPYVCAGSLMRSALLLSMCVGVLKLRLCCLPLLGNHQRHSSAVRGSVGNRAGGA